MVEFGTQMRILNCEYILNGEYYDVQMLIAFMLWILQKTISVTIFSYVQKWWIFSATLWADLRHCIEVLVDIE